MTAKQVDAAYTLPAPTHGLVLPNGPTAPATISRASKGITTEFYEEVFGTRDALARRIQEFVDEYTAVPEEDVKCLAEELMVYYAIERVDP